MATSVVAVKWHERTNQILLGTGKAGLLPSGGSLGCCRRIALQGKSQTWRQVCRGCMLLHECTCCLAEQFVCFGGYVKDAAGRLPRRRQCNWLRRGQKCQPGAFEVLQTMPVSNCHRLAAASPLGCALSVMLSICRRQESRLRACAVQPHSQRGRGAQVCSTQAPRSRPPGLPGEDREVQGQCPCMPHMCWTVPEQNTC